jgi:putative heme-binding domain-containing protein
VHPDGTGLEIYSTGTRNILEVAISPLMDIFARDNTNDGGGWNVRFHHFTGLDDHGYPRLYKNFNDECVQPLADYGGGSGCGAVYIDEPGFGPWNNAPFTCDWGTGALWHHQVKPKGATFEETRKPEPFIKMTRPTDADVDGNSRVYCASWKGATFNWEGPDVGYIVQVRPKGFKAEPLPDFAKAKDEELVKALESASNRRRMEAQREIVRRGPNQLAMTKKAEGFQAMLAEALNPQKAMSVRVAAQYGVYNSGMLVTLGMGGIGRVLEQLRQELPVDAIREASQAADRLEEGESKEAQRELLVSFDSIIVQWPSGSDEASLKIKAALARSIAAGCVRPAKMSEVFKAALAETDPVIEHLIRRGIQHVAVLHDGRTFAAFDDYAHPEGKIEVVKVCLGLVGTELAVSSNVLKTLSGIHKPEVVTGLIERLGKAADPALRQGILSALCRLHFHEGEWKGDSWGTRPDTRGPYYQPEPWGETPKIAAALKDALAKASPEEAAFLVKEMNRNRIQSNDALERILVLAKQDAKVIPDAVAQLATAETIPADGIPLLIAAANSKDLDPQSAATTLANTLTAIAKTDNAEAWMAALNALVALDAQQGAGKEQDAGRTAFLTAPKLENVHQAFEAEAAKAGTPASAWADAALLSLAARKSGSPEAREMSQKALDAGWVDAKRRVQIINAAVKTKSHAVDDKILASTTEADKLVAKAAQNAVKSLKIEAKGEDKTPKIGSLKPEEALAAVIKTKGSIALGEQIFTKATCIACHTTKESEAQKGPYLGNIAQTYKRPELAQNILDPNKTIAQGFASEVITMNDGTQQMGFITLESADNVKLRNVAAQEFTFAVKNIKSRQKLPISIMPPGLMTNFTVHEFASLLDYLESLVKK